MSRESADSQRSRNKFSRADQIARSKPGAVPTLLLVRSGAGWLFHDLEPLELVACAREIGLDNQSLTIIVIGCPEISEGFFCHRAVIVCDMRLLRAQRKPLVDI